MPPTSTPHQPITSRSNSKQSAQPRLQSARTLFLALTLTLILLTPTTQASPATYRGNNQRTGHIPETVTTNLTLVWTHHPTHPPTPAWPAPALRSYWQQLNQIEPRNTDDHTFHPVSDGSSVFYASSSDDQIHSLNAASGQHQWSFHTEGPIRYAPSVQNQRLYAGSDDGHVYCINASSGKLIWKRRIAPTDYRVPGNNRIISAWPVRTGLVVSEDTVYALAGLYPQQDVFATALHTRDGSVLWQTKVTASPQGYLLLSRDLLYVPTGRSDPIALDRATGQTVKAFSGVGGTFAIITENELIAGRGNDGTLAVSDNSTRTRLAHFKGQQMVLTPSLSFLHHNQSLSALDRPRHLILTREIKSLSDQLNDLKARLKQTPADQTLRNQSTALASKIATSKKQLPQCQTWKVPSTHGLSLLATDNLIFAGGPAEVAAHRLSDGELVWKAKVDGPALGLTLVNQRLLVSTTTGALHCFAPPQPPIVLPKKTKTDLAPLPAKSSSLANRIISQSKTDKGYALIVGLTSAELPIAIAKQSAFKIIAADNDPTRVATARNRIKNAGLGHRISVHLIQTNTLPYAPYFANVIASESSLLNNEPPPWPQEKIYRLLRPAGGRLWMKADVTPDPRPPLAGAGSWSHQFGNPSNNGNSDDKHIKQELVLQWFGGPGPKRMVDRHLRAPAPLAANGRLFIPGENSLIAVDAYNGTELWELNLPNSQRYSMPYDAGYMSLERNTLCIAVQSECWIIDGANGNIISKLPVPGGDSTDPSHWGYTTLVGNQLFGSIQNPKASRTQPSRNQINVDYNNNQPLVTSRRLFSLSPSTTRVLWNHSGGTIINPTITIHQGQIYFVESRNPSLSNHPTGRILLADLMTSAFLICLNAKTGQVNWERPLPDDLAKSRNILYCLAHENHLALLGSWRNEKNDTLYQVSVFNPMTGTSVWSKQHAKGRPGAFTHGEQVHHPIILNNILVAEPVLYNIKDGSLITSDNSEQPWRLERPGHSCGTLSGAGSCVFFRANNPTALDINSSLKNSTPPTKLAPSRPGCWINIIPASGLVLIPEASSGCVCSYSIQTSMAFRPVGASQ